MISDYLDNDAGFQEIQGEGMQPTYDVWGQVLDPSDSTGKGSVRVKVSTMKENMDTFEDVPVLTFYGGGDHGFYALPEKGDIVRLTFLGGDFRHPVVTGCRFPYESQFVKDSEQEKNLKKHWKTSNGSSFVFSGEKGKDKIQVLGSEKMDWELDEENEHISFGDKEQKNRMLLDKKNGKAELTAEKEITVKCGKSSLELKQDGTIILSCETLSIDAKSVQIKGKTNLKLQGQEVSLEGTTGVTINSNTQMKVQSKGSLKLSGAMIDLN